MRKINLHIEIVSSTTKGLSSMSKASRDAIFAVLDKQYAHVGITIVNTTSDLEILIAKSPDLVFLGMKFLLQDPTIRFNDSNKIWLAEYLAEYGIATTGSPSKAHRLESNKSFAKKRVLSAGLKTSAYYVARVDHPLDTENIPSEYPLFVKPTSDGGGSGIDSDSVVYNLSQLKNKIASISQNLDADSLIEKYLIGREYSVAILKNNDHAGYAVMPIELVAPIDENGERILSKSVKQADTEHYKEITDIEARRSINDLALNAFRSLGGRDYGRIDIRMDEHGEPHFLEANLIPSLLDKYGNFPKACALNIGLNYEDMLIHITNLGIHRSEEPIKLPRDISYAIPIST